MSGPWPLRDAAPAASKSSLRSRCSVGRGERLSKLEASADPSWVACNGAARLSAYWRQYAGEVLFLLFLLSFMHFVVIYIMYIVLLDN